MMLFCPICANMLTMSRDPTKQSENPSVEGTHRFECRTCPYQMHLNKGGEYFERRVFTPKTAAEAQATDDAARERVEAECHNDKCDSREAYFWQSQIRSADEPMTSFFQCTKCMRQWREN